MRKKGQFWTVTLSAALALVLTLSLGFWQLRRADQKLALEAVIFDKKSMVAAENAELFAMKIIANAYHHPVRLRGHWLHAHTVFLDNRQMNARQGFYVLTPLKLSGRDQAIVVQRGWVPRNFQDRTLLPALPTSEAEVTVQGRLAPPPAKLYELAGTGTGAIRQNLDLAAFAAEIRQSLVLASVVQTEPTDAQDAKALQRNWPQATSGVDRHHGYAAQWFALAVLIATLYVWFQFIAPRRKSR
jgi:surfeit locus 1 family protein